MPLIALSPLKHENVLVFVSAVLLTFRPSLDLLNSIVKVPRVERRFVAFSPRSRERDAPSSLPAYEAKFVFPLKKTALQAVETYINNSDEVNRLKMKLPDFA